MKHLKLNPTKLKFKLKETFFMGNIISDTGLRADPAKVNAVTDMPTPRDKAAVLCFIGMVNFPHFARTSCSLSVTEQRYSPIAK